MDNSQASGLNSQMGCVSFTDMESMGEGAGLLSKEKLSLRYPEDIHTDNNLDWRQRYRSYQPKQRDDFKSWDYPEPV